MNYRKHGLKALGLSFLAVLGFMAFAASGAQASGGVLVEGLAKPFTVGITGKADELTLTDRLWVLGLNLEVSCHKATVTNGLLTSSGHGSATILFEECLGQGVNAAGELIGAACIPTPKHVTAKVLALIILHEGNIALGVDLTPRSDLKTEHGEPKTGAPYILFTPQDGLTFGTVTNTNEECLLPESAAVKGCVVAKIHTTGDQITHLIDTRKMLELFGCELTYGNQKAHLDADALLELTNSVHGNHLGLKWGVE